ncbi:hypothetical protein [Halorussus sp. AFM4]|uniref:hypothetical protein n=1 Tax=Halorussus sp. AFM4 TaxID=3421651 RepID=UPI003EBF5C0D
MAGDQSAEITFNGAETDVVLDALRRHEPGATDATEDELDDLESRFDRDLDDAENATVELNRGDATVVLSALNESEVLADERDTERIASLRERLAEEFDLEDDRPEPAEPMEDEQYSGGT